MSLSNFLMEIFQEFFNRHISRIFLTQYYEVRNQHEKKTIKNKHMEAKHYVIK